MLELDSEITEVPYIGSVQSSKLEKLGIKHVVDLISHFPTKYQDSSQILSIEDVVYEGEGTIRAEIIKTESIYTRNGKVIIKCQVQDQSSTLELVWFNQKYLTKVLKKGKIFTFQIKESRRGNFVCSNHEEYDDTKESLHIGRIAPQYPQTSGVSSKWLRSRIKHVLENAYDLHEYELPKDVREEHELIDLKEALNKIHFPEKLEDIDQARKRLTFDEIITLQFQILEKKHLNNKYNAIPIKFIPEINFAFQELIPFELTSDQKSAIRDIGNDMRKRQPMHRLLNGDVGSGKTVVALGGIIQTMAQGYSVLFLAPTTILAKQHFDTLDSILSKVYGETILISSESKEEIPQDGTPRLIVGTHALLHRDNLPQDTALVVVDEQHRFGVEQRNLIKEKVTKQHQPHYLMMTATPIPRTLTNTLYGDMDVSLIESMPHKKGEKLTYFVKRDRRDDCYSWVKDRVSSREEQAFIVFPLIEEDPTQSEKSVKSNFKEISNGEFKNLRCELLHGKVKPKEKSEIMKRMKEGEIDVLFSTTVIEVGMDIPNATIMVIEGAELFGLAQLHQLRGRIGRNEKDSFCYLLPSVKNITEKQDERLQFFSKNNSGFEIAQFDLESRGPGEVFGSKQAGIPDLLIASILDRGLIRITKAAANKIYDNRDHRTLPTIFDLRRKLLYET